MHNIELVEVSRVVAVSGYETHPFEREGFKKAYELAKKLQCPILTISLDRISRNYDHLLEVLDKLRREGIEVYTIQEEWLCSLLQIPDATLRKFIYDIIIRALAFSYQKYIESLIEKTKAGMERARREGKHIGRPPKVTPELVQKMRLLHSRGFTIYEIAKILGLNPGTVYYWLKKK